MHTCSYINIAGWKQAVPKGPWNPYPAPKTLTTSGRLKWIMQEEFLKLHSWEFCETPQHGCQQSKPNETRCLCHRCHPLFRISTEDLRTSCVEKMKAILAALPARSLQWHGSLWVDETVKNCRSSWRLTSILEDYRLLWADSFITYSGWGMDPLVKTEMLEEWKVVDVTWCITLLVETCQSIHRKCDNDSRNQCCVDISLMIHDWNTNVVEYIDW